MTPAPSSGRFAGAFRESYLRSLDDYRFFYDDLAEIGNPAEADHAFYFVPTAPPARCASCCRASRGSSGPAST
jgi:hypothetical protein